MTQKAVDLYCGSVYVERVDGDTLKHVCGLDAGHEGIHRCGEALNPFFRCSFIWKSEYKTLEQQIKELWASRGMTVIEETVETLGERKARWLITATWGESEYVPGM